MSRHRRRALALTAAGVVAAIVGIARIAAPSPAPAPAVRVQQVVLVRAVGAGQRIRRSDLGVVAVPVRYAADHRLTDPAQAAGRRAAVALPAGSPLMDAEVASGRATAGLREVAVRLDPDAGVPAGDLAGGRADIFVTTPRGAPARILADVIVVAAGRSSTGAVATLLLPPAAVPAAIAAEGRGALRLVVRTDGTGAP